LILGLKVMIMVTTGPGTSWKVLEFRKTIFQAWKVMKNGKGHGKSWKLSIMSWKVMEFFMTALRNSVMRCCW